MKTLTQHLFRGLTVFIGIAIGIVLFILFVANRQIPERNDTPAIPKAVTIIEVKPLLFRIEARGHGVVRPSESWKAVANVSGRVVERHSELDSGNILTKGTLLVALDPSRYKLAIAEAEAELRQIAAEETNTQRLVDIERQALNLAEQELSRIERLASGGSISKSQLDTQRRTTLAQRQALTTLENTLLLIPSRRERAAIKLSHAERDLTDTQFFAPYDLRISEVNIDLHEFVGIGHRLFEADSLNAVEIETHLPFSMMKRVVNNIAPLHVTPNSLGLSESINLNEIDAELDIVGVIGSTWKGQVVRVANGLDPSTRAVRVVVRVDQPWLNVQLPDRPPLQRNMYAQVRLSTLSTQPKYLVPAAAVHQGEIYVANELNQLEIRPVKIAYQQGNMVVIEEGLEFSDRIIVNDLQPAIEGMALNVRHDFNLEARVALDALGSMVLGDKP